MQEIKIIATYRDTTHLSMRISKKGEVLVSVPYALSQAEIELFVYSQRDWIEKALQRSWEQRAKRQAFFDQLPLYTPMQRFVAQRKLKEILIPLVRKYAKKMGLSLTSIILSPTKSKWGSCQVNKKQLQFSLYLLLLPQWCIEHVVVHELAHFFEPNHSKRFYAIMDKYFPRWREAKELTTRISRMEEETQSNENENENENGN